MSFYDPLEKEHKKAFPQTNEVSSRFFYNIAGQAYFDTEEKCFVLRFSDNENEDNKIKDYLKTMIREGKNVDFVAIPGFPLKKIKALCSLIFCGINFSPEWWSSISLFSKNILYDMDDFCMLNPLTNEFMKKLLLEKRTYQGNEYFLFNTESIIAMTLTYNMLVRDTELRDDPELTDLSLLIPQDKLEDILANRETDVPYCHYLIRDKYSTMGRDYVSYSERKLNNGIGDNEEFSSLDGIMSTMSMREFMCLKVYPKAFNADVFKKIARGELIGEHLYKYMRAPYLKDANEEYLFCFNGRDKFLGGITLHAPYHEDTLYSLDAMIDDPLMFYYTYCLGKYSIAYVW